MHYVVIGDNKFPVFGGNQAEDRWLLGERLSLDVVGQGEEGDEPDTSEVPCDPKVLWFYNCALSWTFAG